MFIRCIFNEGGVMVGSDVLDTRGKILQAAIDIVGLKGEVTIREIAEKAGVNVASINYYFGNKNNLLKEVESYFSEILYNMQYKILEGDNISSNEKLVKWTKSFIDFLFEFPSLFGLIGELSIEDKDYKPLVIQKIYLNKELQERIKELIKEETGIKNDKILNYKYVQLFSGIVGLVISRIVSDTFGDDESIFDINKREELNEYANLLINGVLSN